MSMGPLGDNHGKGRIWFRKKTELKGVLIQDSDSNFEEAAPAEPSGFI